MLQIQDTEQVTGVEHEAVRTAFNTLFTALETTPHYTTHGIRLWNDRQPIKEARTEDQIRQEATTWLGSLLEKETGLTIVLVNAYRKRASLDGITQASQVVTVENIELFVQERLQRQEEYMASLPYRIPDDQLATLNEILSRIGILPVGTTLCNVKISIRTSHRFGRSDDLKISGYLAFDGEAYPTVNQYTSSQLVREFRYSIGRDRGEFEGKSYDEFELSIYLSSPESPMQNPNVATELLEIRRVIETCKASIATRCEQACCTEADLELLKFVETVIGRISAK
jgi:hypothetical protein